MGRVVIAEPSLSDAAALTSSAAVAGLPVTNLQKMQPGTVFRSLNVGAVDIVADLGAAQAIDLIALLYTNATSSATWRIRAATSETNLTASPGYDSGAVSLWPTSGLETWAFVHGLKVLAAAQSFRWWRIDVDDTGHPSGFLDFGRLYLAASWQPTRNLKYGWSLGFEDDSEVTPADGGQLYPLQRGKRRVLDFTLDFLGQTEMYANAFELDRLRGNTGDVLAIRDPDVAAQLMNQSVCGLMSGRQSIVHRRLNVFRKAFTIRELMP